MDVAASIPLIEKTEFQSEFQSMSVKGILQQ
jgi:hypothetical protein